MGEIMKKVYYLMFFVLGFGFATNTFALQVSPFDNPKNLKVLSKDITSSELRETMRGFAFSLGVRCTHCHVSETPEGADRPQMFFDRDDKENKRIAREMLRLVEEINSKVENLERGETHDYQTVTCTTCHRGQNKPILIQTVLDNARDEGGISEAIKHYNALK